MKKKLTTLWLIGMLILQTFLPVIALAEETLSTQQSTEKLVLDTSTPIEETTTSSISVQKVESESLSESSEDSTATTNEQEGSVDKDSRIVITDNLLTDVILSNNTGILPNTVTLPNGSGVKVDLDFGFSNKNYQAGDTFITQLPEQFDFASNLSGTFTSTTAVQWAVDASTNQLAITFLETPQTSEQYDLSLTVAIKKIVNEDDAQQQFVFHTTPTDTIYDVTLTSDIEKGKPITNTTIEGLNPKKGTIESIFNLERDKAENQTFIVEASVPVSDSKLIFTDIEVYKSNVDFNGNLTGTKTELIEGTDYQIFRTGIGTSKAKIEIKLLKSIGEKAILVDSTVSGVNGSNYIKEETTQLEYSYFQGTSTSKSNATTLGSSNSQKEFATLKPIDAKGKLNPETGIIDWTIHYNFNEQPITTVTELLASLADQGMDYVPDSLRIEKVGFDYTGRNDYITIEQGDGIDDWEVTYADDGSLKLISKKNSEQAYVIKYSTKIKDSTEKTVTNSVTDGTNSEKAEVSINPNLIKKEAGTIDTIKNIMDWTITINEDRLSVRNIIVHDYFLGDIIDYSFLSVKRVDANNSYQTLVEGTDYIVESFDSNGSPLGVQPGINGAPDVFNGGIRIKLIGNFADISDMIKITLTTDLDPSSDKGDIKNKAIINYNDNEGYLEAEAEAEYVSLYENGGKKIGATLKKDDEYIYQTWLILLNTESADHNMVTLKDVIPAQSEYVPGSINYREITTQYGLEHLEELYLVDKNLAIPGDATYPTYENIENNELNLEFGNLGKKIVVIKYQTRVKRDWLVGDILTNTANVLYNDEAAVYTAEVRVSDSNPALGKTVVADATKTNVANWTITTKNISEFLEVENPVITDTLTPGTSGGTYDPTSFVITNEATGERVSTDYYSLTIVGNTFTIEFTDYTAVDNLIITYDTISEFPGKLDNVSIISSPSYGELREASRTGKATITLNFSSGSGSGVVKTSSLEIMKVDGNDSNKKLEGAVFELLKEDGTPTGLKGTTDASGHLIFEGIPVGKYQLKELNAPTGYDINLDYESGKIITLIENMPEIVVENYQSFLGNILLKKTDSVTGKSLEGAVFKLLKEDGTLVSEGHTTDSAGKLSISGLVPGKYQLVETQAPTGYTLDDTPIAFEIQKNQATAVELAMTNTLTPGDVILTKTDSVSAEALEGAVFKLLKEDGILVSEGHTTDSAGKLSISGLVPGKYQLVETQAPTGYTLDDTPIAFEIQKNQATAVELAMTNTLTPGSVTLTKMDSQTAAPLAGATFELQKEDGTQISSGHITDSSGKLSIADLAPGHYHLLETQAPTGYLLDNHPVSFEIIKGQKEAVQVAMTNTKRSGSVVLTKIDGKTAEVLAGAVFELQAEDGTTLSENHATDYFGKLAINDLAPGNYQFVETQAPSGYMLDATPLPFEIKGEDSVSLTKANNRLINSILLTKLDEETRAVLAGAEFELRDEDEKVIKSHLQTNQLGQLAISKLALGKYTLVETKAPNGYILDATPIEVELSDAEHSTISVTKTNKLNKHALQLTKINRATGQPLAGVQFDLLDKEGKAIQSNLETDANGQIFVEYLTADEYQLVETQSIKGYLVDSTPKKFTIKDEHTTVKIKITNQKKGEEWKFLPQTGESLNSYFFAIGMLLLFAVATSYVIRRYQIKHKN